MTVLEALKQATDILDSVNIPISLVQKIGNPVNDAVTLVKASINAMEQAEKEQKEESEEGN